MSRWWAWRRFRCIFMRHHEAVIGVTLGEERHAYCGCGEEVPW